MASRKGISGLAKKKLLVLVDLDEVLAAFERHFLTKFRELYPNEPYIPLEKRNTFYIGDQYETLQFKDESILVSIVKIVK